MGLSKSLKSIGRYAAGVGTGGLSEVYRGATGKSSIFDLLKPDSSTVEQVPLETPEQRAARIRLNNFSATGKYDFGGGNVFTAGEGYGGSLGDFNMTPEELASRSKLSQLIARGRGDTFAAGERTLNDLLTTDRFDPYSETGEFAPFKEAVARETRDALGRAKGAAAYSGNLYSSRTAKNLGNIESDANIQLQSKLAQLFSEYTGRKIAGIGEARNYATAGQNIDLANVGAGYQYGGLERSLNTAKDQAAYQEFLRQRQEKLLPITTAGTLANKDPNFGVPSITTQTPSPWMQLLQLGVQGAGAYFGAKG